MLKAVVACVILCGMSFPVLAGERTGVAKARANMLKASAVPDRDPPARVRAASRPFMLPAAATPRILPKATVLAGQSAKRTDGEASEPVAWGPGSTLPEITARAGGSYAVYDVMRAQPRPRHRESALSTALVLRLDGEADSPAFSVGGGGVAAAVWRAVPR
ncbi:hypothetical protein [Sphingomonas sp. UNC305MFCol5.2]|uniref:hypothetical protein n=1 Tax=Sphingomonas sp. UNC305MFCol5.2 TaxID=1449076 RepID=UPI0004A6DBBD|nr:hypothetical protein [Sphingomonas sp. UNC305MFCol5.2]